MVVIAEERTMHTQAQIQEQREVWLKAKTAHADRVSERDAAQVRHAGEVERAETRMSGERTKLEQMVKDNHGAVDKLLEDPSEVEEARARAVLAAQADVTRDAQPNPSGADHMAGALPALGEQGDLNGGSADATRTVVTYNAEAAGPTGPAGDAAKRVDYRAAGSFRPRGFA
jgi:hypothetical protein